MNDKKILAENKMYELAEKRGLIPQLIILCADARKESGKIGVIKPEWSIHGLLRDLGKKIQDKMEIKYPILCEDQAEKIKVIEE